MSSTARAAAAWSNSANSLSRTADEGREFLHWVDVEHSAGRCSLEQFGEFVVALDLAEQRAF
jgi:hypothetical protein